MDVWTYPDSVDHLKFIPVFRQRVRDQYIAQWNEKKAVSTSLQFYKEFVPICKATYLNKMVNIKYRYCQNKVWVA